MSQKIKILHLENDPGDSKLISQTLNRNGLVSQILVVETRGEFLSALEDFEPDIILSNHSVPSFHSFEVLEVLEELKMPIPVIIVTTKMTEEFAVDVFNKGARGYVLKHRLEKLASAVEKVLKERRQEQERKSLMGHLQKNEHKFRRLVENGTEAVAVIEPNGTARYFSPTATKILGYSEKEALEINTEEILHEDFRQPFQEKIAECLRNPGIPFNGFLVRARHKNNGWRWMQLTLTNFVEDSAVEGIIVHFNDVTERTLAEKALKESEEKYRSFFENSLDGILLTAPTGKVLAANPGACKMFQRTEKEICEVGRVGMVDLSDPRVNMALRERQKSGNIMVEINMVRKDGSIFPAALSSAVFQDANGEELTSMIIRDISKAKCAEEDLKASDAKYRQLFEKSPLPNLIYDVDTFEILDINKAAMSHYGFSREEFLQLTVLDFLPVGDRKWLQENISKVAADGDDVRQNNLVNLKKDGERIQVEVYGYNLRYKDRNCRLIVCLDITEKEVAAKKLREKSEKLLLAEKLAKFGYWGVGIQEEYFFWSDEVYRIWGRKKEEFQVGLDAFLQTIHPDDLDRFNKEQETALSGIKDLDFQHRIILPDGGIKWVHEKGKLVKDSNGQPYKFEGSVQDITDYKNAMIKLKQSEDRHRGILQSQTNYLIRLDLDGHYTYCNEKFEQDFAWLFPNNTVIGEYAESTIEEYHREKSKEFFINCIAKPNVTHQIEIDKMHHQGVTKTTLWDFICLTDAGGNPLEVQGVGIDISGRVKAERSLKESNARYELASKATSDALYDWDIKTGHLYWGESFYALFGYSSNTFSSTLDSWLEKVHPKEKQSIINSLTRGLKGNENHWEAEYRFKKANGKYSFVIEKGFILRDENGEAYRMVGAIRDLTEKKKLQELLDEASRFARIGSFEFDFEQDSVYWSPVTKEIHEVHKDFDPSYETGITFYKEGESRNTMSREFKRAVEENISYDLELPIVTAKGNERWVREIGRPTFVDGKCVRINGSFQDITNLKNSELKALKASEERQVILESIGDAFFAVDHNWIVTYWNSRAVELLHLSREECLGKNLWDLFPDSIDTNFYFYYHKALEENSIEEFEEFSERTGNWFGVSVYPSKNGLSVYFRDVTERRNADLKLRELNQSLQNYTRELVTANKGLEQFSFIVSHNLRSPVANIIGLGDLLQQDGYPAGLKEKFLQELLDNVKRLDNVINDLNAILQVKVELNAKKELVPLEGFVASIKEGIQNLLQKEQVQITTDFQEVPEMNTVQSYLHSIFYNLISNSIKYRNPEKQSKLHIKSQQNGDGIFLIFSDNGMGMDLTSKENQVFELYKRFHHNIEGKGMGLFMVKTQVELLGGKISVESEVNKGSEFTIEFKNNNFNKDSKNEKSVSLHSS